MSNVSPTKSLLAQDRGKDLALGFVVAALAFVLSWSPRLSPFAPFVALVAVVSLVKVSGLGAGVSLLVSAPFVFSNAGCERSQNYISAGLRCGTGEMGLYLLSPILFGALLFPALAFVTLLHNAKLRRSIVTAFALAFALVALYSIARTKADTETFPHYLESLERRDLPMGVSHPEWIDLEVSIENRDHGGSNLAISRPGADANDVKLADRGFDMNIFMSIRRDPKRNLVFIGPSDLLVPSNQIALQGRTSVDVTRKDLHEAHSVPKTHRTSAYGCFAVGLLALVFMRLKTQKYMHFTEARYGSGGIFETVLGAGEVVVDLVGVEEPLAGATAYLQDVSIENRGPYRNDPRPRLAFALSEAGYLRILDQRHGALLLAAGSFAWSAALLFGAAV
jgi:hypothetical protein